MTEETQSFNVLIGDDSGVGMCGPDGCSIADHQKENESKPAEK